MASKTSGSFDAPRFFANVQAEAERLRSRYWGANEGEAVERAYEVAAKQALRAPVLAERSVLLRRVGKRVIPARLVPVTKRAVRGFDRLSRRAVDRISRDGTSQ